MQDVLDLLTPDQIDAIQTAYGSLVLWFDGLVAGVVDSYGIITEDIQF